MIILNDLKGHTGMSHMSGLSCDMPLCDVAFIQEIEIKFKTNMTVTKRNSVNGLKLQHKIYCIDVLLCMVSTSSVIL